MITTGIDAGREVRAPMEEAIVRRGEAIVRRGQLFDGRGTQTSRRINLEQIQLRIVQGYVHETTIWCITTINGCTVRGCGETA